MTYTVLLRVNKQPVSICSYVQLACCIPSGIFYTMFTVVSSDLSRCLYVCWKVQCVSRAGAAGTDWFKPGDFAWVLGHCPKY